MNTDLVLLMRCLATLLEGRYDQKVSIGLATVQRASTGGGPMTIQASDTVLLEKALGLYTQGASTIQLHNAATALRERADQLD